MVLLAAAICSKEGKALVSRQFVEMSKSRIEGLIATFPKLVDSDKQHTFIETDSVRYVYQPLEKMYVLLITTKASNILEDLETLRLFARVIPEYARGSDVSDVVDNAFQIIFAFDEIVALGYRESVTLSQIRTFTEMDSHDERIFNAVRENQEKEAKALSIKKAREFQLAKSQALKQGVSPSVYMDGYGGSSKADSYSPHASIEPSVDSYDVIGGYSQPTTVQSVRRGGMKLGDRSKKDNIDQLTHLLQKEAPSVPIPLNSTNASHGSVAQPPMTTVVENLHINIEEKLTVHARRDGGLETMELAGIMQVLSGNEEASAARILVKKQPTASLQTHPNIDKSVFQSSGWLQIKSGGKNFPIGQEVGVLKWRLQTQNEADIPVLINSWPNEIPGGFEVNIVYELQNTALSLQNFLITIPLPPGAKPPLIGSCDGEYEVDSRHNLLLWTVPLVDADNASGSLDFTIKADRGAKVDHFFPVKLDFFSNVSFCGIQVLETTDCNQAPIKHSCYVNFHPESYEVV